MEECLVQAAMRARSEIAFECNIKDACIQPYCKVLDTDAIEAFTLEKFKTLMILCMKEEKDFVIAMVTTRDPSTDNPFYSYYSAIDLNNFLFCVEGGYLMNRMGVKNPANNLSITEKVLYYRILHKELLGIWKDYCSRYDRDSVAKDHEIVYIKAEYFAYYEDFLFDSSVRQYFSSNSDGNECFTHGFSSTGDSLTIVDDQLENYHDDKFSLKIILYTNMGTILAIFTICMLVGSREVLMTVLAPLLLTMFFSVIFLVLYVLLFETPECLESILNLGKRCLSE
ncbi:hypothetical protein M896_090780 [Ordospora colligata OC4]|uniref:Uncharacterized protein n=1 Tax=Ordospora colligata OC4 TaxID=1354746 RepID=A0A0B2UJC2_9MICR|nr:uncharacterized protein M896_090780 [Ordospora colligata OC4]KHN69152.1 hypothetical protein M896_090780 [Ordospora colligata OC4]